MTRNPFLLAADNSPALIPLLQESPDIAKSQDEHGYSLVHAAASYNHLDLLRTLIRDFEVDINIKDEDNETALFVVETVDAARALIDLGIDIDHRGLEGTTAGEKIELEADFPEVAAYLNRVGTAGSGETATPATQVTPYDSVPPPDGMKVTFGSMPQEEAANLEVDPEFRRRIEELAERADFDGPEGQAELRKLVEDAITDQGLGTEKPVRQRQI